MAKIVSGESVGYRRSKFGPNSKYPWEKWTDGNWWEVTRGQDFQCTTASFVSLLHLKARGWNMRAATSTENDTVTFKFYILEDGEPSPPTTKMREDALGISL